MTFPSSHALALRFAPHLTSFNGARNLLLHHSMPAPICLEWERQHNADQYKMFSWNGWVLPGAEDCESGVACKSNQGDDECCDWGEEGLIVEAKAHPKSPRLQLARAFFGLPGKSGRRQWRFGEKNDPGGVLDQFTLRSMRIFDVVEKHLRAKSLQPLFWGFIKALREAQAHTALPKHSAKRVADGRWCGTMTLELVADFLVGRRVFLEWAARSRRRGVKRKRRALQKQV
jgi:hypothetical protein